FHKILAELQGTTELQEGPWTFENGGDRLKRVVTFVKAATKIVKAVRATEEQTYLKADGNVFAVLVSVSTPDIIYGNTFQVELLYCIAPGPEVPTGEQSSRLVISWRMNFLQTTMMKVDMKEFGSNKEQVLASFAGGATVRLEAGYSVFIELYCGFHYSRGHYGSWRKAQGDGWLLTVALIEGSSLAAADATGFSDPYVVFTCNGKTRTSSIKFQKAGPQWNVVKQLVYWVQILLQMLHALMLQQNTFQPAEIFEFDAMDDPPSVLEIEVGHPCGSALFVQVLPPTLASMGSPSIIIILCPEEVKFFMELFSGGYIERKVMERVGCLEYS
ncbi:hypothetical protein IFM89_005538, partial [Coptis chinensis]